jgi:hypothetical protein
VEARSKDRVEQLSGADLDTSSNYSGELIIATRLRIVAGKGFVATEVDHE